MSPLSRRKFLGLLSVSAAFAAVSCKDYRDKGAIVPYNKQPENITLGKPNFYASALADGTPVLIKTREGRPIKIDGNPEHPLNKGKISVRGHANILSLYDPERIQRPMKRSGDKLNPAKWDDIDNEIISMLQTTAGSGKEISIIYGKNTSPTFNNLLKQFSEKYPTTKIYTYDLFNDSNKKTAWKDMYGTDKYPLTDWAKSDVILSIDGDFLGNEGNLEEQIREFTARRDSENPGNFNRLYTVEGALSLTGANSDYRLRLSPVLYNEFLMALIQHCDSCGIDTKPFNFSGVRPLKEIAKSAGIKEEYINLLVKDLKNSKGKSIVYGGNHLPVDTHYLINILNELLGNKQLYRTDTRDVAYSEYSSFEDWKQLVGKINSGKSGTVLILDKNPVFHLPEDLGLKAALEKANTIYLGLKENETSETAKYILPIHHALESWGDFKPRTGMVTLQQPVIEPLYDTRQKESLLLVWSGNAKYSNDTYHKYLMMNWEEKVYPTMNLLSSFRQFWNSALHDGFITYKTEPMEFIDLDLTTIPASKVYKEAGITVQLRNNYSIGDGSYADNGWLQELPHPISKTVWDNYAAIAPATAKKYDLENNDLIKVKVNGREINLPVLVQPGTAENLIVTELGYGRTKAGVIGTNVGFDASKIMTSNTGFNFMFTGAEIAKTGETYKVVSTQEHHDLDDEFVKDFHKSRDIIQEGTVEEYEHNPEFLKEHKHKIISITPPHEYKDVKWGMAIDLNKCIGCNNCVASCNVENNIPVVSKDQVEKGREMHWMRIDRYYSGTPDEPETSIQPMLCQHCDNAPCENVCPVVATTHSPDGLNQMTYNRCVGTRYCANNCPYKVRRFNFFDFREHTGDGYYYQDSLKLLNNPEVTVRSRGVMEKCTFCVQRIMDAREESKRTGKPLKGSDVKTACQEACPAEAILFGDLNDPDSKVSKLTKANLGYRALEILNVKPNVTYTAKLRNRENGESRH